MEQAKEENFFERQALKKSQYILMIEARQEDDVPGQSAENRGNRKRQRFQIIGLMNDGGESVICYKAKDESGVQGVLKEFYPQVSSSLLQRNEEGQLVAKKWAGEEEQPVAGNQVSEEEQPVTGKQAGEEVQAEQAEQNTETTHDCDGAYQAFLEDKLAYRKSWWNIGMAKNEHEDLQTLIPYFELFDGCDQAGGRIGTTYVWTPEAKQVTFQDICKKIHEDPEDQPEAKLFRILSSVRILTESTRELHEANLLHRDINPSNFAFHKRGKRIQEQTLSFFDIDSVCPGDSADSYVGESAFTEPEAKEGMPAVRKTDIYSIGATLFYAIYVPKEDDAQQEEATDPQDESVYPEHGKAHPEDGSAYHENGKAHLEEDGSLYRDEYFPHLAEKVGESRLVAANSWKKLQQMLTKILERCLCRRESRYQSCGELLTDLDEALLLVCPPELRAGQEWIWAGHEEAGRLLEQRKTDSQLAIQYHLSKHPLYRYAERDARGNTKINVLLLGFGYYGQKFLDAALQVGQMPDTSLNVFVASGGENGGAADSETYLKERPELKNFFSIMEPGREDGKKNAKRKNNTQRNVKSEYEPYGTISFLKREFQNERKKTPSGLSQDARGETLSGLSQVGQKDMPPGISQAGQKDTHPGLSQDARQEALSESLQNMQNADASREHPVNEARRKNEKMIQEYLQKKGDRPHYIFIALGDDDLNYEMAGICQDAIAALKGRQCVISYVNEGQPSDPTGDDGLCPLYINDDFKKSSSFAEIERMAFNAHLVWEKDLNIDVAKVWDNFRQPYNYVSSISNVLSAQYKLHSLGIDDLKNGKFEKAARRFKEYISTSKGIEMKNKLVCIEHRRWVTEKICQGWTKREVSDCADGVTKDPVAKNHVCIVKSRPGQELAKKAWRENHHRRWDEETFEQSVSGRQSLQNPPAGLDELDRVSVELHRAYRDRAEEVKEDLEDNLVGGETMLAIERKIKGNRKALAAFREWRSCLIDITHGEHGMAGKVHMYKWLKGEFLKSLEGISKKERDKIIGLTDNFERNFRPLLLSMEYLDWKQNDADLIENIPFILTYHTDACMILPLDTAVGKNGTDRKPETAGRKNATEAADGSKNQRDLTRLFQNVAAASIVNPAKIVYVYYAEEQKEIADVNEAMVSVLSYMRRKNMKATVDLVVFYHEGTLDEKAIRRDLTSLNDQAASAAERTTRVSLELISDKEEEAAPEFTDESSMIVPEAHKDELLAARLENYLKKSTENAGILAMEMGDNKTADFLKEHRLDQSFPCYTYDTAENKFSTCAEPQVPAEEKADGILPAEKNANCSLPAEVFGYIRKISPLTVADMVAFGQNYSKSSNQPEFYDICDNLWDLYRGYDSANNTLKANSRAWKALCGILKQYEEQQRIHDITFRKLFANSTHGGRDSCYTYLMPSSCRAGAEVVCRRLKFHGLISEKSRVIESTTSSCKVTIVDNFKSRAGYDELFLRRREYLKSPDTIEMHWTKGEGVEGALMIQFNDLDVTDCNYRWEISNGGTRCSLYGPDPAEDPVLTCSKTRDEMARKGRCEKQGGKAFAEWMESFDEVKQIQKAMRSQLEFLEREHYVLNKCAFQPGMEVSIGKQMIDKTDIAGSGKLNMIYATKEIKDLLCMEGRLLEVHTFHSALKTGGFDDIVSSYEITWKQAEKNKNEFDCILTKDFRTMLVECKAREKVRISEIDKLVALKGKMEGGINTILVIVNDVLEDENTSMNDTSKEYAREKGVVLITEEKDIDEIGSRLLELISEKTGKAT